jgi:hypothetical protein
MCDGVFDTPLLCGGVVHLLFPVFTGKLAIRGIAEAASIPASMNIGLLIIRQQVIYVPVAFSLFLTKAS